MIQTTPVITLKEPRQRVLYALQPKQLEAWSLTPFVPKAPGVPQVEHIGYGGAAGGGKSYLARAVLAGAALLWPGSSAIIFRKTEKQVLENHVNKFRQEVPDVVDGQRLYSWVGDKSMFNWENGSKTYFGYLRLDGDEFNYQGNDYDLMIFEEATHYRWSAVSWLIGNRLRATIDGTRPFAMYPSNPGSLGHYWFKRLFVDRLYNEEDDERPDDYAFIQAKLADNEILRVRDPKYERRLNKLAEPWRSWLRDGDFLSGAGGAFGELSAPKHLIPAFPVPPHWRRWGSFDWGFTHPFSFGEWTVDEDGQVYKLNTVTGMKLRPTEMVRRITRRVDLAKLEYIVAGHDLWAKRRAYSDTGEAKRLVDTYAALGMYCVKADIDRLSGYANLSELLAWRTQGPEDPITKQPTPGEPRLVFIDTPGNRACFRQLENMVNDPKDMEDVLKVDADEKGDGGDDMYDETRYGAQSAHRPTESQMPEGEHTAGAWRKEALEHEALVGQRVRELPVDPDEGFWDPDAGYVGT